MKKRKHTHHKHPPLARANWSDDVTAPLHGLVLAGGFSKRMGTDKGAMDFHGKPQREYTADLLAAHCEQTFLSCRSEQQADIESEYAMLFDTFLELGPFGALLSAFRANPNAAWIVLACDLPNLQNDTIEQLIAARDPQRVATAFRNSHDGFPEPLIAIWEPRAYAVLLDFLSQGRCCPRKVLINNDTHLVEANHPTALLNANSPEDLAQLKQAKTEQ